MLFLISYRGNSTAGSRAFTTKVSPLGFRVQLSCLPSLSESSAHTPVSIGAQAATLFLKAGRPRATSPERDPNSPSASRMGGWGVWVGGVEGNVNRSFNQYAEQAVGPVFTQWSSTLCQGL